MIEIVHMLLIVALVRPVPLAKVQDFVGEAVQSDDIAVCALGHKGFSTPPKGEVKSA